MEMTRMGFTPVTDYLNHTEIPVESKKSDKNIILSASLLMRLMEFAKEDAKDDVALHQVLENVMAFSDGTNPLTIDEYDTIVANAVGSALDKEETPDEEECEDCEDAEAPKYDIPLPNGDTQVNHDLCQQLRNAVDSYYEGGIDGEKCYNAIQQAFDRNEQNVMNNIQQMPATEYEINVDDGSVCDGNCCYSTEEEPSDFEEEIKNIINAGKF